MKQETVKKSFSDCTTPERIYQRIMEWGKNLPSFQPEWKIEENLVPGCQSQMYLHSTFEGSKVFFWTHSDALISLGLAALLIAVYSDEEPETILTSPPTFLDELGIPLSLTPGRANGLASLHLKMKQRALTYCVSL